MPEMVSAILAPDRKEDRVPRTNGETDSNQQAWRKRLRRICSFGEVDD
jgi:hypothetical protein